MFQREESRHDFAFMAGVVVGAIAGVLVTLALTPFSGAEARTKLRERTGDLSAVKDRAAGVATTAKERVEPVREKAAGVASTARDKVEPVRERAREIAAKSPLPVGHSEAEQLLDAPDEAVQQPAAGNDIVTG